MPQMSKSPYISQFVEKRFMELREIPNNNMLNKFQSEIMEELLNQDEVVEARINLETEEDMRQFQAMVTTKIVLKVREESYAQFLKTHGPHMVELQTQTPYENILNVFLSNLFYEFQDQPELKPLVDKFEATFRKHFEQKVLEMDDTFAKEQVSRYRVILLEDKETLLIAPQPKERHPLWQTVQQLLVKNKTVRTQFIELVSAEMRLKMALDKNADDAQFQKIMPYMLKSIMQVILDNSNKRLGQVREQSFVKFSNELKQGFSTFYTVENDKLEPLTLNTFQALVEEKQFNPKAQTQQIMKKLGF